MAFEFLFGRAVIRYLADLTGLRKASVQAKQQSTKVGRDFGNSLRTGIKKGAADAGRALSALTGRFGALGTVIGSTISPGTVAIVGMAAALGLATKAASEFETAFAEVTTLFDTSVVQVDKIREELLGLSPILGSATELTKGLYQAISAGTEPAAAVQFIGQAAKLARAGLASIRDSVDILTTVINAYGLAAEEATRVSDVLFKVVEQGKTTLPELSGALGRVIPFAAQLGVSIEDLGAAVATLTKGGLATDIAVTALRGTFVAFIQQADKFRDAGFDILEVIGKEGLGGAFRVLKEVSQGNIETIKMFIPDARALSAVLALAGSQSDELTKQLGLMQNAAGATEAAFAKQTATLKIAFQALGNAISLLGIAIGTALIPVIRTFVNAIAAGVKAITAITKGILNFVGLQVGELAATKRVKELRAELELTIDTLEGLRVLLREKIEAGADTEEIERLRKLIGLTKTELLTLEEEVKIGVAVEAQELRTEFSTITKELNLLQGEFDALTKSAKEFEDVEYGDTLTKQAEEVEAAMKPLRDRLAEITALSEQQPNPFQQLLREKVALEGLIKDVQEGFNVTIEGIIEPFDQSGLDFLVTQRQEVVDKIAAAEAGGRALAEAAEEARIKKEKDLTAQRLEIREQFTAGTIFEVEKRDAAEKKSAEEVLEVVKEQRKALEAEQAGITEDVFEQTKARIDLLEEGAQGILDEIETRRQLITIEKAIAKGALEDIQKRAAAEKSSAVKILQSRKALLTQQKASSKEILALDKEIAKARFDAAQIQRDQDAFNIQQSLLEIKGFTKENEVERAKLLTKLQAIDDQTLAAFTVFQTNLQAIDEKGIQERLKRSDKLFEVRKRLGDVSAQEEIDRLREVAESNDRFIDQRINAAEMLAQKEDDLRNRRLNAAKKLFDRLATALEERGEAITDVSLAEEFQRQQENAVEGIARTVDDLGDTAGVTKKQLEEAFDFRARLAESTKIFKEFGAELGEGEFFRQALIPEDLTRDLKRTFDELSGSLMGFDTTALEESTAMIPTAFTNAFEASERVVDEGMSRLVARVDAGTIRIQESLENKIVDAIARALEFDDMRGG